MKPTIEAPVVKNKLGFGAKILIIALFFVALAIVYVGSTVVTAKGNNLETQPVSNVFVDINGDGKVDLIVKGEVVINQGQGDFPLSQPSNK